MALNESIIDLNISTVDGVNRNRVSKKVVKKLKHMLVTNKFLEELNIVGINLGNDGWQQIVKAYIDGLDEGVKEQKAKDNQQFGEFI